MVSQLSFVGLLGKPVSMLSVEAIKGFVSPNSASCSSRNLTLSFSDDPQFFGVAVSIDFGLLS